MAAEYAVVRNTLTQAVSGTTDFTKTGFGTPTAAIIITCAANSTNNPQAAYQFSIGFWDGTNQAAVGFVSSDAQTAADTARRSSSAHAVMIILPTGTEASYTCASTTDGIRLTQDVDATALSRYCTVILMKGISASLQSFTANATQDATQASASLGFAPKVVFCMGAMVSAHASATTATGYLSFGVAEAGAAHRSLSIYSLDGADPDDSALRFTDTRCIASVTSAGTAWSGEITTFGADTFTMTTRDGAATNQNAIFCLALGGADLSYDIGTLSTATSTGNQTNATDVAADALLLAFSTAAGTATEADADANGFGVGLADDNGQFSHNGSLEDAAGTTNCNSAAQSSRILDLDTSVSGSLTNMVDATVTLNNADFTLNYTAVNATARKGFWVAFGPVPSGDTDVLVQGMQNIGGGVVASQGGGYSGLHPIETGFVS